MGRAKFISFDNTTANACTALMERVFYHVENGRFVPPALPLIGEVPKILESAFRALRKRISLSTPMSVLEFPERSYSGLKLKIYRKAARNVFLRGVSQRDAGMRSFVKFEKILLKPKRIVPRLIQPRTPEYNVEVGRYIKHLEHSIYHILDDMWGGPTVMKGLNSFQQGKAFADAWTEFSNPVAIMLDAVRFDQHVSVDLLKWEHAVYLLHYRGDDRANLARVLSWQLHNHGVIDTDDSRIKYSVDGCRMSGDMNTALGNCLLMCSIIYSMLRGLGIKARLFNNGDDCCIIAEYEHFDVISGVIDPYFRKLGFLIDVEGMARELEHVSFCQTSPVFDGTRWRMVRDPRICLSKDSTCLKRWTGKEWYAYWCCFGKCGLSLTAGIPIFQDFYSSFIRYGDGIEISERLAAHVSELNSGMYQLSRGIVARDKPITDSARFSFARAFGITPEVQRHLEQYFRGVRPIPPEVWPGVSWGVPI